jgi:hypothetical protein
VTQNALEISKNMGYQRWVFLYGNILAHQPLIVQQLTKFGPVVLAIVLEIPAVS